MKRAISFMLAIVLVLTVMACSSISPASDGVTQTPLPTLYQTESQAEQQIQTPTPSTQDNGNSALNTFTASTTPNPDVDTINTLDDAIQQYFRKVESNKYLTGDHFVFSKVLLYCAV